MKKTQLEGIVLVEGIVSGKIHFESPLSERNKDLCGDFSAFAERLKTFEKELQTLQSHFPFLSEKDHISEELRRMQLCFLLDPTLIQEIEKHWDRQETKQNVLKKILENLKFRLSRSSFNASRLIDFQDILAEAFSLREIRLFDEESPSCFPTVLLSEEPAPSLLLQRNPSQVAGIFTTQGDAFSHLAILCKSKGIPMAVLSQKSFDWLQQQKEIHLCLAFPNSFSTEVSPKKEEASFRSSHPITRSEPVFPLALGCNINVLEDCKKQQEIPFDGVYLVRTEFLFFQEEKPPSLALQMKTYQQIIEAFPEKNCTFRLFDFSEEKEPLFLSTSKKQQTLPRGLSALLANEDVMETQLLAFWELSKQYSFQLVLPFSVNKEEIEQVLENKKIQQILRSSIPLGAMIENKEILPFLPFFLSRFDFLSVGTNDLLASCDGLSRASGLNKPPNVYSFLFWETMQNIRDKVPFSVPLTVCGELGGNPFFFPLWVGMGYNRLSCQSSDFYKLKEMQSQISLASCKQLTQDCLQNEGVESLEKRLKSFYEQLNSSFNEVNSLPDSFE